MLLARALPMFNAFFRADKSKLNFLKQRRVASNTCLREINTCLVSPEHATPDKIKEIRQRLLRCIVDTIRAFRNDLPDSKIYSNLLIPDGEHIIVAIRNAPDRLDGTRYKKSKLLCGNVLTSKKPMFCGDVQNITDGDLSYKSFNDFYT